MEPDTPLQSLSFWHRGRPVTLGNVPPERTLLDVLREDLGLFATKEGCGEGDCGACTVVLSELDSQGGLRHRAINSCIRLAHSVQGMAVWTAADIGAPTPGAATSAASAQLHPVQEALVRCHGSQCGFCTPGFVMSLWALYQNTGGGQGVTREQAQAALSGNLCRCTGYRPILDAAQHMGTLPLPEACALDTKTLSTGLRRLRADHPVPADAPYLRPSDLTGLLQARARHPKAQLVAGCTDVGLWVTKQHRRFERIIDLTGVAELQRVEDYPHHIAIGAAVNLSDAFAALVAERPALRSFCERFAGLPVRNSGTLGGNVANGSPIGDSMPLLLALGASVVLMRWQEGRGGGAPVHRELPLADFYLGYRQHVMRPDEVLAWIKVPRPTPDERLQVYKVSKRFDDDISAVCLALRVAVRDGTIHSASVGVGGVAATPVRARQTEAALIGQACAADTLARAGEVLAREFQPISDLRASADHRRTLLRNLMRRAGLTFSGVPLPRLESLGPQDLEELA